MIGLDGKTIASEHLSMRLLEEGDKKDLRTLLSDEDVTRPAGFLPAASDAVFADCFVGNTASQKLIEKCGYRYLGNYTLFFEELSEKKTCRCYVRDNNL